MWVNATGRMIAATPKILPAVYDDAMTYYEQLKILNCKLNEVIDIFNDYGQAMLDDAKTYTDTQLQAYQQRVNQQISQMQQSINDQVALIQTEVQIQLDDALDQFKEQSQQLLTDFTNQINEFNSQINNMQIAINTLFDIIARMQRDQRKEMLEQIAGIFDYIDKAIAAKFGENILVYDPWIQGITNLNAALDHIYQMTAIMFSITVEQYKRLELTVDEYKELQLTVLEYKYKAIWIFFRELFFPDIDSKFSAVYGYINDRIAAMDKSHYMVSPFTGVVTPIRKVVYQLAQLHMHGITADQYKDALLSADAYKALNLTAYDYAWNGYYLIYTGATPVKTLEEQIEELQKVTADQALRIKQLEEGTAPLSAITDLQGKLNTTNRNLEEFQVSQQTRDASQDDDIDNLEEDVSNLKTDIPIQIQKEIEPVSRETKQISDGLAAINIKYPTTNTFSNLGTKDEDKKKEDTETDRI